MNDQIVKNQEFRNKFKAFLYFAKCAGFSNKYAKELFLKSIEKDSQNQNYFSELVKEYHNEKKPVYHLLTINFFSGKIPINFLGINGLINFGNKIFMKEMDRLKNFMSKGQKLDQIEDSFLTICINETIPEICAIFGKEKKIINFLQELELGSRYKNILSQIVSFVKNKTTFVIVFLPTQILFAKSNNE